MRGELDINENVSPRKVIQSASDTLHEIMSPNPAAFILCIYLSEDFMSSKKSDWVPPISQTVAWDKLLCQWSEF